MHSILTDSPTRPGDMPGRKRAAPSEALNRFEPPEGFAPVRAAASARRIRFGFRAAGLTLLIREGIGSETLPVKPLAIIPNGPAWLLGILNLRGNLVPVIDLGRILGNGTREAADRKTMILVLGKGERSAGFVIEGHQHALTDLRPFDQVPTLPEALAPYVPKALSSGDDVWLEFEHEAFLEKASRIAF